MQREVKPTVEVSPCRGCSKPPRLILSLGKGLYHFECSPCETRTIKVPSEPEAAALWASNQTETIRGRAR